MSEQISISRVNTECPLSGRLSLPTGQLPFHCPCFQSSLPAFWRCILAFCMHTSPPQRQKGFGSRQENFLFPKWHLLSEKVETSFLCCLLIVTEEEIKKKHGPNQVCHKISLLCIYTFIKWNEMKWNRNIDLTFMQWTVQLLMTYYQVTGTCNTLLYFSLPHMQPERSNVSTVSNVSHNRISEVIRHSY